MIPQQNKMLHALLAHANLTDQKANLVMSFTSGRTDKSSEMNAIEAKEMIAYLRQQIPDIKSNPLEAKADKMRKKILSMARELGWTVLMTNDEGIKQLKADMLRINAWCAKYGYLHKPLNNYTFEELPKLISQFGKLHEQFLNEL